MTRNLALSSAELTPLFRSFIGFDRLMDDFFGRDLTTTAQSYPPYNIEKTGDDAYQISMAVAGFGQDDLDIKVEDGTLTIQGKKTTEEKDEDKTYLHRGIATRTFTQSFRLADHVEVKEAQLVDGMLKLDLVREVPEKLKPRKIELRTASESAKLPSPKAA